jgi:type I restriction enzyme S subunit
MRPLYLACQDGIGLFWAFWRTGQIHVSQAWTSASRSHHASRGSAVAFPALRLVRVSPETYRSDHIRSLLEANFVVCCASCRTLFFDELRLGDSADNTHSTNQGSFFEKTNSGIRCIDDELPFEIPESWAWARLGSVGVFVRGSGIKRDETRATGVPCVRYGEIYTTYNIAMTRAVSFVDKELAAKSKPVNYGDLLLTLTGENKDEIGKAVAFMGNERTVIGGDLATFTSYQQNPMYLSYLMNSPLAIQQKKLLGTGDIIVHISCDKLATVFVPIPPLAEQARIVTAIEELSPLIEDCAITSA